MDGNIARRRDSSTSIYHDLSKIKLDSEIREIYQIKEKLHSLAKRIQVQEAKIQEKEKRKKRKEKK